MPRKLKLLNFIFVVCIILQLILNAGLYFLHQSATTSTKETLATFFGYTVKASDALWEPKLKRTDNYTAFLIAGIDSRELIFDGNTFQGKDRDIDTMIQVVYNYDNESVSMFSIPRDTGATTTDSCIDIGKIGGYRSINHVYKLAEDGKCPGGGVPYLEKYVSSVTGFENHYFSIISYKAFRDIINAVGEDKNGEKGLYIDVEKNLQEYYPREVGGGFEPVYFAKGNQFINSTQLLKYARSRHATSDFDRARRQQQVIEALQAKLLSSEAMLNPFRLYSLYEVFKNNALFSELSVDDVRGILSLAQKVTKEKQYKYVLDDAFAGMNSFMTRPSFSGNGTHNRAGYYLSPVAWNDPECVALKDEYCKLKPYLKEMVAGNPIFLENAATNIYTTSKGVSAKKNLAFLEKFNSMKIAGAFISNTSIGIITKGAAYDVYDLSDGKKPLTKDLIEKTLGVTAIPGAKATFKKPVDIDFVIVVKP